MTQNSYNKFQDIQNENDESVEGQNVPDDGSAHEPDRHELARRDLIVYLLYSVRLRSTEELTSSVTSITDYNENDIIVDIEALKDPETYKLHKHRVRQKLFYKIMFKRSLTEQGTKAIYQAMDNSASFDADFIVDISKKYEYTPSKVVSELLNYKRLSTQIAIFNQSHKKFPVIQALIKCAKLNVMY